MARLSKVPPDQAGPELRKIFDAFLRERGNIPNLFRTLAHRPEITRTLAEHFDAVMNTGTVEKKLKEMVAVRVSHVNRCDYWLASHTALARRLGVTEAELAALASGNLGLLGERERAAVEFAEQLTRESTRVGEELFGELQRHFSEGEIVEIATVAGLFNCFNRLANALQVEPTR